MSLPSKCSIYSKYDPLIILKNKLQGVVAAEQIDTIDDVSHHEEYQIFFKLLIKVKYDPPLTLNNMMAVCRCSRKNWHYDWWQGVDAA